MGPHVEVLEPVQHSARGCMNSRKQYPNLMLSPLALKVLITQKNNLGKRVA